MVDNAVRGYSVTHPPGTVALQIEGGWDQLLYAASGTMTILTLTGSWTIPPDRAIWIPESESVAISSRSRVAVRSLYFRSSLCALPAATRVMNVSGFGRELLLHTVRCCPLNLDNHVHAALVTVLVDQLRDFPDVQLWLPQPVDPRAIDFTAAVAADISASSIDLARQVGASRRTLERLFVTQTGLSLGAWRRRFRILSSLSFLAEGVSVDSTAMLVGYSTSSAYITAFKRELEITPREFFRQ